LRYIEELSVIRPVLYATRHDMPQGGRRNVYALLVDYAARLTAAQAAHGRLWLQVGVRAIHGGVSINSSPASHTTIAPGGPSWDELTAVGTLALAAVTLITLLATVMIALRSDQQLRTERKDDREREQLTEAYAVSVLFGGNVTIVVNRGKFTITKVEAQLRLGDGTLTEFLSRARLLDIKGLDAELRADATSGLDAISHSDLLTPWDLGLRFVKNQEVTDGLFGAYPIVRWTDRWGTRWEHKLGEARTLQPGSP
jgi:hypothetical protein